MSLRAVCLANLLLGTAMLADDALPLPPDLKIETAAAIGTGTGSLTAAAGEYRFQVQASALGAYVENWKLSAAVFDFRLAEPLPLPLTCAKLALAASTDSPYASLRLLIQDRRGGLWAVNTRLYGLGTIPRSAVPEWFETFRFASHEMGRLEPWVIQPLDPAQHDYFDPPQPPLSLAGFRVILNKEGAAKVRLASVVPVSGSTPPDPYWHLGPEAGWSRRVKQAAPTRFGWGPSQPGPYLRASDLQLTPGKYRLAYEILAAEGWQVVAAGAREDHVTGPGWSLALPLLPQGLYHLRLTVTRDGWGEPREFGLQYLVLRNSRPVPLAEPAVAPKPLAIAGPGNILAGPAACTLTAPGAAAGASIAWTLESSAGDKVAEGQGPATAPVPVAVPAAPAVVWLTARLQQQGRTVDVLRRVFGQKREPVVPPAGQPLAARKFANLKGLIQCTKGDWDEGSQPIESGAKALLPQYLAWLDDAKQVGYNIVELPAPWYDEEPLPGVYQFDTLDTLVQAAKERGLAVVLRVHPKPGIVPDWLAPELQEDENGLAHGLWAGGTNFTWTPGSLVLRQRLGEFLTTLAARYRQDPLVVGYTLSNLFFDHGWHDMPWLGQTVDYSDSSRRAFVAFLRQRYGNDLAAVAAAHRLDYHSWEDLAVPHPALSYDAYGRAMPRPDRLWLDWAEHKNQVLADFRIGAVDALRAGDPACEVGIYQSTDVAFSGARYQAAGVFMACGSMEDQYPPDVRIFSCRYEPHAKVARGGSLVDVGVTNLLFHQPGYNTFFNYWKSEWRVASVPPDIKEAEDRLKTWFGVIQELRGAREAAPAQTARPGLYISALQNLIYVQQHTFSSRLEDLYKPFVNRLGAEKLRLDSLNDVDLAPAALAGRPYVYLPYAADVLTPAQGAALAEYVRGGGKLIVEATSGLWQPGVAGSNQLGRLLELPEALPVPGIPAADSEAIQPVAPLLEGLALGFRIRNWNPPIETQVTPWIHNVPRAYLRAYRLAAAPPAGATVVGTVGDQPAAFLANAGKGQVLVFAGVLDWLASPGLAQRLDQWGRGLPFSAAVPADPAVLASPMTRPDGALFVVGRRFVGHALLGKMKQGQKPAELADRQAFPVLFPQAAEGSYRVRELLTGKDLGVFPAAALRERGVPVELTPGEGFVLQGVRP